MRNTTIKLQSRSSFKTLYKYFVGILLFQLILSTFNMSAASSQNIVGKDTLNTFTDVPGLAPSEFYTVRVRSAATNNLWVNCYVNITRNLYSFVDPTNTVNNAKTGAYYFPNTINWSHSYANIEMSLNSLVEVEIAPKNGFTINGAAFTKAAVHPSQRANAATITGGNVYFTLSNPAAITVDINGQMDDYQPANLAPTANITDAKRVVHTITIFAHPIMKKPSLTDPTVLQVIPGTPPPATLGGKTTVFFTPGIHNLGLNFKIQPGIQYYIPGDAIVYGTLNNIGVAGVGTGGNGDNIKIYGLGTISGDKINHPINDFLTAPTTSQTEIYKVINIQNANNALIEGVFVANNPFHGVHLASATSNNTCRWVKVLSWRTNGDGIGDADLMEDCFLRTADDCSYVKGTKKRCCFWKDSNAAVFHFAGTPVNTPILIDDCDVLYLRSMNNLSAGDGVFVQRIGGPTGVQNVDVTIQNCRISDPHPNVPVFSLVSYYSEVSSTNRFYGVGSSFYGITFKNISIAAVYKDCFGPGISQRISGNALAPWYGGVVFDGCTIAGQPLALANFKTDQYVTNILFSAPGNFPLTTTADSNKGSITRDLVQPTYVEASRVVLTAVAKPGYTFAGWSGSASGTTNPLTVLIQANMNVTANFLAINFIDTLKIETPGTESWTVPTGVNSLSFQVWGGGGAGGSTYCGTATANTQNKAGGGAGGSYASVTTNVTPGQVINFTVGAGGIANAAGFANLSIADSGGTSNVIINNLTIASAQGGPGGMNVSAINQSILGTGGVAPTTGNIGSTVFYGGAGATAGATGSGGGGGSAGQGGAGGSAASLTAGVAGLGGGASGGTGSNNTATLPTDGSFPGGGGAGAALRNGTLYTYNNLNISGGNGAIGKLLILKNKAPNGIAVLNKSNNDIMLRFNSVTKKLSIENLDAPILIIELFDITGKLIYTNEHFNQNEGMDLSQLKTGLYIVKLQTNDRVITSKVWIK
jgi:uncharacterized repeat protein (TIGR02543 family)